MSLHDTVVSFRQLEQLDIQTEWLKTEWASAIADNPMTNIAMLRTTNKLANISAAIMATNLTSLTVLVMLDCTILKDDALLSIGRTLSNLRELEMRNCRIITNAGIEYLAGTFPNRSAGNQKLERLHIENGHIMTDKGLTQLANLKNLRHLHIQDCPVGDMLCDGLAQRVSTLTSLALAHSRVLTIWALYQLSTMASLKKLHVRYCIRIGDAGLRVLAEGGSKIEEIDLDGLDVSEIGLRQLARLTELRQVSLRNCRRAGDAGLTHLTKGGVRVNSLKLYNVGLITDAGIVHVVSMTELRTLHLQFSRLTDDGVQGLVDSPIVELRITGLSDTGLGHLARMRYLRDLRLVACPRITDAGLARLGACQLTTLHLDPTIGCTLTNIARVMPRLRHLQLCDQHLKDEGLAAAAYSMRCLESFVVDGLNRFGDLMRLRAKVHQKWYTMWST